MRSLHDYTVILRPDDNGTFVAYVPAIEGCHAWGITPEAAQAELVLVFEMICEEYQQASQDLPNDLSNNPYGDDDASQTAALRTVQIP